MNATAPRLSRAFWVALVLGGAVIAYGVGGALAESHRTQPAVLARWVLGALAVHDLLLAPLVGVAGLLVVRVVPRVARAPVQAGLLASVVVVAVAIPALASLSERPGNPTVHPIDYRSATLTVLGVVWALAGLWFGARVWRSAAVEGARPRLTVAVIAKAPRPGHSKTRLCPPCTPAEAAAVARGALEDTLAAMAAAPIEGDRVVVLDGPAGPWLPSGFVVVAQRDGGLGERLADAFAAVGGPALVVGMDTPQITPELLGETARALDRPGTDAVLGLTDDGGYWVIGLRRPDRRVFEGVPMSSPGTGEAQLARLHELGCETAIVPRLRDVDDFDDALAVAEAAPESRFAAALREVAALAPPPTDARRGTRPPPTGATRGYRPRSRR